MSLTSNFEEFKNHLANENKSFEVKGEIPDKNLVKIKKNLIIGYVADASGCGHIRCIFPLTYLNAVFGKSGRLLTNISPFFITQQDVLARTRTLFFQRQMSPHQINYIKQYKELQSKFRYKMVFDLDDFLWKGDDKYEGLPSYNFGSDTVTDEVRSAAVEIMNMMDTVTVSSEFLVKYFKETLKVVPPVVLLNNSVPQYLFGSPKPKVITEKLTCPKVIYSGSPTHWHEGKKLLGDWASGEWLEFIKKQVTNKKIELIVMGCQQVPFFFKELEGKSNFKVIPWLNSYQYTLPFHDLKPDFGISMIVKNMFNFSKSDLKYIEYCALGILGIGTKFKTGEMSPYDKNQVTVDENVTVKELEDLFEYYSYPEHYNKVIADQFQYLIDESRYLESIGYVNKLTSIL